MNLECRGQVSITIFALFSEKKIPPFRSSSRTFQLKLSPWPFFLGFPRMIEPACDPTAAGQTLNACPMDRMLAAHGITEKSQAQLKQDIFVLLETGFKCGGFFVEFGCDQRR